MVSMSLVSNNGMENLHFSVIPIPMVMVHDNVTEEFLFFVNFETRGITWLWNAKLAAVVVMIAIVCSSKIFLSNEVGGWDFQQSNIC